MSSHVVPVRTSIAVFVALLMLLFATVGGAFLPLGVFHLPLALTIAAAKAVLIGLFFVHLYYRHSLTWMVSLASLLWLGILLALTLSEFLFRGWLNVPGK
jgi:cytochrome c oxidase subunit 4